MLNIVFSWEAKDMVTKFPFSWSFIIHMHQLIQLKYWSYLYASMCVDAKLETR
jgi:hypothetical protein